MLKKQNEKEFLTGSRERNGISAYDQAMVEGMIEPGTILKDFHLRSDHQLIPAHRLGILLEVNVPEKT